MKSMTNSSGLVKAGRGRKAKALGPWVEWDRDAMDNAIQVTAQGLAAPPPYASAEIESVREQLRAAGWRRASESEAGR